MSQTTQQLTGLAESLVALARKKGADEVEIEISQGKDFSVEVRNGEIEKLEQAGTRGLSIRLLKDQKTAVVNSSDFKHETLNHLIENAVKRAQISSPDPFAGLPEFDPDTQLLDPSFNATLEIYDPEIETLTPQQKIELAKKTESIALQDERVVNSYGSSFGNYSGEVILINSKGFSGSYQKSSCSLGVYLQAGVGDNKVESGWYESSLYFQQLWKPEQIAEKAVQRVTRMINPQKVKTQNVPVVLEPPMTRGLLYFLYQCVNGRSIYMKQSFLLDRLQQKIANANVSVIDDGLIPRGMGTKPFDGEGVPVRKNVVIDNGVLKTYLTDTYSARKLKMKSTGNASGANNFYLEAGQFTPEDIIKSVDRGLLLTKTMGQGTNPVTGDISRGAFGIWIENGELSFPVAEITISGNLAQMLNQIEMVGNDLRFNSSITGPTIKVAEMTVSGI
ncbi:MAG TPA: TldD/PmbA family protein [bacterium]|nr:TldD/PmbA family protein [bacterium]